MKIVAIIPARLSSSRLPNKPLEIINGKSMIEIVYKNVLDSKVDEVYVACDDLLIYNTVVDFGGKAILTSKEHNNGTSRVIEASENIDADFILNVQGDEPLLTKSSINNLLDSINSDDDVYTLYSEMKDENIDDPSIVKVVMDKEHYALYFSRSRIPYNREANDSYYKHIGIYLYKKSFLKVYNYWEITPLEFAESLEQLRILENKIKIKMILTNEFLVGVDTKGDLELVRRILNEY